MLNKPVEFAGAARPKHIAIIHTWPETKNAEYETIVRFVNAARMHGISVSVVDNFGKILWSTIPGAEEMYEYVSHQNCDFAISLHFESPKLINIYTYYALWNPIEFYFSWGYDKSVVKMMSHDDVISCASDVADAHAYNLFAGIGRSPLPQPPVVFHSMAKPGREPRVTDNARVFYVGINWEKISQQRGRHHELLRALDDADLIDIYGPEIFNGVKPWEDYKNYRGSIPFNGQSIVDRISDAGICLAFSSAAHQRSEIMSNRLCEGLAAGALVIANKHRIIEKYMSDTVFVIDDDLPPAEVSRQVVEIVRWARANPDKATDMARRAQKVFLSTFALDDALRQLHDHHEARVVQTHRAHRLSSGYEEYEPTVTVVVQFLSVRLSRLKEMLQSIATQDMKVDSVHLILDTTWFANFRSEIESCVSEFKLHVSYFTDELFRYSEEFSRSHGRVKGVGRATWRAISDITTHFFLIYGVEEDIFHNHLRSLCNGIRAESDFDCVSSGLLVQSNNIKGERSVRLEFLAPLAPDNYIFANGPAVKAQHMFRRSLIEKLNPGLFDILDGQEHVYLLHMAYFCGGVACSNTASIVYLDSDRYSDYPSVITPEQQHQFIRDAGRAATWNLALRKGQGLAEVIYAIPNGSPVPWADYLRRPGELNSLIRPGHRYEICKNGGGARFLRHGFYGLEDDGIWMEGRSANLEFVIGADPEQFKQAKRACISVELEGRSSNTTGLAQRVQVFCNGLPVATMTVPHEWGTYDIEIDLASIVEDASVHLRFLLDHADVVLNAEEEVVDPRLLGMRIRAIQLDLVGEERSEAVPAGEKALVLEGDPAASVHSERPGRVARFVRWVAEK